MRKGLTSILAATATVTATAAGLMLAAAPAAGQDRDLRPEDGPKHVVPAAGLINRLVHDDIGAAVAVVRDVVIVRDTGQALAVLEVLQRPGEANGAAPSGPSHVVAPLGLLRLPADGGVRLAASAPALAALPAIDVPPTAVAQGLMVPPPEAGPLRVIAPSGASPPVPSQLAAQPR